MTVLVASGYLEELHNKWPEFYPEQIKQFDWNNNLSVVMNYAVWDIKHGTLLKLSKGRRVTHAIRGLEKLSDLTIKELYGEPPMFDSFRWIATGKKLQDSIRDRPYWVMMGNSDCYKIPVIC